MHSWNVISKHAAPFNEKWAPPPFGKERGVGTTVQEPFMLRSA